MTVACNTITPDITGFVTNTSACELPDPSDPDHLVNDSADNLNTDELFGITDWTFIAKSEAEPDGLEILDEGISDAFTLSDDPLTTGNTDLRIDGEWSIDSSLWNIYETIL